MNEKTNCKIDCCVKDCKYHTAADQCTASHINVSNEDAQRKAETFCAVREPLQLLTGRGFRPVHIFLIQRESILPVADVGFFRVHPVRGVYFDHIKPRLQLLRILLQPFLRSGG